RRPLAVAAEAERHVGNSLPFTVGKRLRHGCLLHCCRYTKLIIVAASIYIKFNYSINSINIDYGRGDKKAGRRRPRLFDRRLRSGFQLGPDLAPRIGRRVHVDVQVALLERLVLRVRELGARRYREAIAALGERDDDAAILARGRLVDMRS